MGHLGDPEVEELGHQHAVLIRRDEDVVGLQIAVHHALGVGARHRAHHRQEERSHLTQAEDPAPQPRLERLAAQELEHEVDRAVLVLAHVEHVDHVGVLELRCGPRLLEKAPHHLGIPGVLVVEDLHRDGALGPRVHARVDGGHSPGRHDAIEPVLAGHGGADALFGGEDGHEAGPKGTRPRARVAKTRAKPRQDGPRGVAGACPELSAPIARGRPPNGVG